MGRIIAVYGLIAAVIVIAGWNIGMLFVPEGGAAGMVAGYLSMLVATSFVFVGIKRYRDTELGGVIRFWPAFWLGLGIASVAAVAYVFSWEVYMWKTDYAFMNEYIAGYLKDLKASGASAAEIAKQSAEMQDFAKQYEQPLFRMLITLSEFAPIGLLVPLVSAALLRKSNFMPAKAAA
ncbi:DUF4199 domain-containing protein [Sphingorhabdus pulchriflava]|uniref:DUF4199 domain-containing protein n=1 Tax=Sphingorhabdus pulchriflava TaxID=2292257 RepID=A0A371BEI9_9SPHN|nr:DUF4199 domain-containing protein [Sphingorhabdus pulchriflava]RDV05927.1 DUF4199 domain-containing protein [Sphingorhabdus pulchriflava]